MLKNSELLYEKNTKQNTIDLAKLICAILVILFHSAPFHDSGQLNLIVYIFIRGAVPFFFASSGFLLYRETNLAQPNNQRIKRHILKTIRLYLLWSIVYFPLSLEEMLKDPRGIYHAVLRYIRDFLFSGSYIQLWYLNAAVVSTTLIAILLHKRVAPKQIFKIACIFYFVGLLAQSWFGLIRPLKGTFIWRVLKAASKIFGGTTRNGLFMGFVFTGIGMLFAFYDVPITKEQAGIGYLISMLFTLAEALALKHFNFVRDDDVYLFLLPTMFFAFAYILRTELPSCKAYRIMRSLSSIMYFIHMWIMYMIKKALQMINEPLTETWMVCILTLTISLICAMAILMLSKCKKFGWLKKSYS